MFLLVCVQHAHTTRAKLTQFNVPVSPIDSKSQSSSVILHLQLGWENTKQQHRILQDETQFMLWIPILTSQYSLAHRDTTL